MRRAAGKPPAYWKMGEEHEDGNRVGGGQQAGWWPLCRQGRPSATAHSTEQPVHLNAGHSRADHSTAHRSMSHACTKHSTQQTTLCNLSHTRRSTHCIDVVAPVARPTQQLRVGGGHGASRQGGLVEGRQGVLQRRTAGVQRTLRVGGGGWGVDCVQGVLQRRAAGAHCAVWVQNTCREKVGGMAAGAMCGA